MVDVVPEIHAPEDSVNVESVEYRSMVQAWVLATDLLGGTAKMQAARTRRLPQEPEEPPALYENRLRRSFLYNGYRNAVDNIVSKPFSKPITGLEDLPEVLVGLEKDVDRCETSFFDLIRDCFREAVSLGLSHILTDFPQLTNDEGEKRQVTVKEQKDESILPVLIRISPMDLIGWETTPLPNGGKKLTKIRIRETRIEHKGKFGSKVVRLVRVITESTWELWKEVETSEEGTEKFELDVRGTHELGKIPLVTMYTKRTGFLMGEPPLEDLAWLNVAHWQSSSDQRSILRFARVGLVGFFGFQEDELTSKIVIGASQAFVSKNPDASIKFAEHSGKAMGVGQEDLNHLEELMEILGVQPFITRTGNITATARAIDESRNQTLVQSWVVSGEDMATKAVKNGAEMVKQPLSEDFAVVIFSDFTVGDRASEELSFLKELRKMRTISHETLLNETKRRGVFAPGFDVDKEIEAVDEETSALDALFNDQDPPDPNDPDPKKPSPDPEETR